MNRAAPAGPFLAALFLALVLILLGATACGRPAPEAELEIPEPDLTDMEPQVAKRLRQTRSAVVADPGSAGAWGRFAMVAHAHEMWAEAEISYRRARQLDLEDVRWPYFLGDVLSVEGTDLDASVGAFRRALALEAGYAPAHMRLGKVLVAAGRPEEAAAELTRALELEAGLQPARLALAQIRLSQGELEVSAGMLEEILSKEPRHAQALSTLGQVYMRLGRRDEARAIAERARSAALYNLFSDPVMEQVVAEGVSSVLIWERAKAFFDHGNFEQAALGLRRVVGLQPENADAHLQLAVAYGHVGDLQGSRRHLERTAALEPELADPRVRLGALLLELGKSGAAIPHLRRALELAPQDPDAGWLLGKAQVLGGDPRGAVASFERAEALGRPVPGWAHNEWGSALARTGRPREALAHFRAALATDADNAQALFYTGLVLEGLGRIDEAAAHYCRSRRAEPASPATGRLQALGAICPAD